MENKAKLDAAFKYLRKMGFIARQNYMCCSSCAGAALGNRLDKMKKMPKGGVYYHRQDKQGLDEHGTFCLRYGQIENTDKKTPIETQRVGQIVAEVLALHGIKFEWDGSEYSAIEVDLT